MSERKYTVAEIDALRKAIETRWLFGSSLPPMDSPSQNVSGYGSLNWNVIGGGGRMSRSYLEDEKTKVVEEILRTHMLAGHIASDIYDADRPKAQVNAEREGKS
jgi:hypothetical protein